MPVSPILRLVALSAVAVLGLTAAASAANRIAYTTTTSNLRAGPGTSYEVVDVLPPDSELSVEACTATWCAVVTDDDTEGFIAKSLLKANPRGAPLPFDIQIIVGPSGPFLKFGVNTNPPPPPPPRPHHDDSGEVCVYQQADFRGANFCLEPGDSDRRIPGSFNDNIESISIDRGLAIEVCTGVNFSGECRTFDHSVRSLPFSMRNKITSYSVDYADGGGRHDDGDRFDGPDFGDDGNQIELNLL